jgi:type I restriction-modification system DNA methylase subunit
MLNYTIISPLNDIERGGISMIRPPLEEHTRTQINIRLMNLHWNLNEKDPACDVTQGQARTDDQNALFSGKKPDYVLYETNTTNPIGVIEAKRPGEDLDNAMKQAVERYAQPLNAPLAFAFNDTFVTAKHVFQDRPLKIDGEELQDFIDQFIALRFIREGPELLSAPKGIKYTRDELLAIFKTTNNLLRDEGLRFGYERFSAFAEILFLKLLDESERLNEHRGIPRKIDEKYCWSYFSQKYENNDDDLYTFVHDSVWPKITEQYGEIFSPQLAIRNPATLQEIVKTIGQINFLATDTDVKGDAFEYFLKSVTHGNKDLGEYFTPRHIVRTMVNLVKPIYGETIYDPFCGTGGFLLEAFKYLSLRVDIKNEAVLETLRERTVYGREFTSTARIARMNMILFEDGHSNIEQIDSLKNPVNEKYDVILSNIPYSQETKFGSYYDIPTKKGDSVCVQHIWRALKPNGRAAVIVPETFLYDGGVIGKTREIIMRGAKSFSVVSLPRGVFMPYTPTKTNIIYFRKGGQFKHVYFFVVYNDGFELNTKRKPKQGDSDLKKLLSEYDEPKIIKAQANIVDRDVIVASGKWNLRPFYYMEDIPDVGGDLNQLSDGIIKEVKDKVDPRNSPDQLWGILKVSQNGVFLDDMVLGYEFTQKYKRVRKGDLVYNPYRVNIGSIGIVPSYLDGMLVSPAYVVFRPSSSNYPAPYLESLLKSQRYLRVIMNYSLGSARASLPYTELTRIKTPKPSESDIKSLSSLEDELDKHAGEVNRVKKNIDEYVDRYMGNKDTTKGEGITRDQFHAIIKKAAQPIEKQTDGEPKSDAKTA